MDNIDEKLIAEIVGRVLAEYNKPKLVKHVDAASGILSVKGASVKCEPFDTDKPGDRVFLKDVLELDNNRNLGAGFMEMDRSEFEWTLKYDEVDYIIEGTLEIKIGDRVISGSAGDVIMIPKNSTIRFSAPGYVKFFYSVYPADWYNQ